MKRSRKATIAAILATPILIGTVLSLRDAPDFTPAAQQKIGLVRIVDVIYSADDYVRQLREMRSDAGIAGVLLRIESPGGAVSPSQELYSEVLNYQKDAKPLVVSMGTVAASGGYYIASPAYKIFANAGTITGSIGVIFQFPQYYELLDKVGVQVETIKAGKMKDVGNPHRKMTARDRAFLNDFIEDTHKQFMQDVAAARPSSAQALSTVADGRILTGRQAQKVGLVDSIGTYQDALGYLRQLAGLSEKAKVIEKKRGPGIMRSFLGNELAEGLTFVKNIRKPAGAYFLLQGFQ